MTTTDPEAAEAARHAYTTDHILLAPSTVLSLAEEAGWTAANRRILAADLDHDGITVGHRLLLHNDVEWRVELLCKMDGDDEPTHLLVDMSFETWDRLRSLTLAVVERAERQVTSKA